MTPVLQDIVSPLVQPIASAVKAHMHVERLTNGEIAGVFILFFVLWSAAGVWANIHYARRKSDEYGSRVVSVVHAVLSSVLCFLAMVEEFGEPGYGVYGLHCTGLQQVVLLCSAGYFTMDLVGILRGSYFTWLFVAHHILSLYCLLTGGAFAIHGFELVCSMVVVESSNPFLHTRWLMIADREHLKQDGKGSQQFQFVENAFYATFFLSRIMIGPIITSKLVTAVDMTAFFKGAGVALLVASYLFFVSVVTKRYKKELWIN
ncbi:membrane-associated protein, putative [Bodo saltans]|uniref:Membrane-associated protein, putative n=1 Tax=Bodo saltans TaxID=75058 RepID=A0A0S4JBZ3_BODSA|nr:membrane-associated protein, putative [Bodo saltans]|eukprot:CUG87922.1 membrane-associated protein, putative [Bodo saltans]